ncbi:MAG: hypothetical protein KC708_22115, partial [Anaerolineae bacterium]|nr:hypothetical protein [Anaerolineae bacterium]
MKRLHDFEASEVFITPMLDTIAALAANPTAEPDLRTAVSTHLAAIRASAHGGDAGLVRAAETAVSPNPAAAFAFDAAGRATLTAAGH